MDIIQENDYWIITDSIGVKAFLLIKWGRPTLFPVKLELLQKQRKEATLEFTQYVRNVKGKQVAANRIQQLGISIRKEEDFMGRD